MKVTITTILTGLLSATTVSACDCSHNNDAGRWIDDQSPGAVVASLADRGGGVEDATKQGRLTVSLTNPGSEPLKRCVSVFALDAQSWHNDWFLWTSIQCKEGDDTAYISMTGK